MQPSVVMTTSASATMFDFGAESARPAPLRVYAPPRQSPSAGARLATGLPARRWPGWICTNWIPFRGFTSSWYAPPLPRFSWRDTTQNSKLTTHPAQLLSSRLRRRDLSPCGNAHLFRHVAVDGEHAHITLGEP